MVINYGHREGLKPFNAIPKSLKTETHISDRLWPCDWFKDWTKQNFINPEPSVNQIIQTIKLGEKYREIFNHQACTGVFIMFTCKRLLWMIKAKRESWTDEYF